MDPTEVRIGVLGAARDGARARAYAAKHGIAKTYDSYQALLDDPDIDAIYNPLPNGLHGRWTLAAIAAGKHVLCEKPFTANAEEAHAVQAAAKDSGLVVMEAFHYRYHPLAQRMQGLIVSGELGTIQHVSAVFCFPLPSFGDIRYDYRLAGGATMDAGSYAVHIARLLGGEEPEVTSVRAKLRDAQVDRAMRAELRFPSGHTGTATCSMWSRDVLRVSAGAIGDQGELRVLNPIAPQFWHRLSVRTANRRWVERFPRRASYAYQLDAFTNAIQNGEPVLTPPSDAAANMTVIDSIYKAAGLPLREPTR